MGASKFNQTLSAMGRLLLCQPGTAHPGTVHMAAGLDWAVSMLHALLSLKGPLLIRVRASKSCHLRVLLHLGDVASAASALPFRYQLLLGHSTET